MIFFGSVVASPLIIVNNSSALIFISDGVEIGFMLTPSQQYIVQDVDLTTLFFYQTERAQAPQTFKLICRLTELVSSDQSTTIYWTDVLSKSLHAKHPGRFEIVPQMRLKFQQEHGAQIGSSKQPKASSKSSQARASGSSVSHKSAAPATASSEPTQAVVDALISQFSSLQQTQQSVDTADLKPKRTPPSKPKVSRKK